jgi:hypothetical protein
MLFTFAVFSRAVVVVLSSLSPFEDLLQKRGKTYSEKPSLLIAETYVFSVLISQSAASLVTFSLYARMQRNF